MIRLVSPYYLSPPLEVTLTGVVTVTGGSTECCVCGMGLLDSCGPSSAFVVNSGFPQLDLDSGVYGYDGKCHLLYVQDMNDCLNYYPKLCPVCSKFCHNQVLFLQVVMSLVV